MIDNKHSILEIPGTALYLMDYFESMGYDVVLHEDWEDYKNNDFDKIK